RDCCLPAAGFADPEFRKQCCKWLKDIASEDQSCLPQITPSSLVSPGGPKFIHLFYQFARHVMVEDMKMNSVGPDIAFSEAVKLRPQDVYMANARCRVAYNKLLQIFQREDFVIQEYEKKAQLLIKEIKRIKSEYAALEIQSCKYYGKHFNIAFLLFLPLKVRSMWTLVMETLTSLKKEKEVVDSVLDMLQGCVGQCILDGTDVAFRIPQLLAHRVESDIHQLCTGNVYEGEKLSFLTVIQLLNEALRALREECGPSQLKQQLQVTESRITVCNKLLQDLKAKRLEIEQQHCVSTSGSISRNQEEWEVTWKSFLDLCPFNLIFYQDTVSDLCDSIHEVCYEKDDGALETMMDKSTPPRYDISKKLIKVLEKVKIYSLELNISLHIGTCKGEGTPVPPKILKNGKDESAISEAYQNAGDHVIKTKSPVKKKDALQKARDELAEEVAKTVMSESPQSSEGKGMALEDLISSLAFNPFLTRNQIPRTPENLLSEIRSSWRKAIETEGSSGIELGSTEVMIEEAPVDGRPIVQKVADSGFTSPEPDVDPPLSERKSQLSSTALRLQEQIRISHIVESAVLETSGTRESERTEGQELTYIVLNESCVEDPEEQTFQYVNKNLYTPGICSENNSRTNVLPSDHSWHSLMDGMLHWNASPFSSISREAGCLGILDETLPEELDNIDPNKSASSETHVTDSTYVTGGSKNEGDIQTSKLDLQSLLNKKTASRSEEELHQTRDGDESVSCRLDLSLTPEKRERDEFYDPLELFCLDEEFTKTPSPKSDNERKYSLSSVLVSCQHLEEMASMVHEIPLDLIHKWKGK
ncbi:HAUS6 protein, partial [Bucorvus abyssinicus]|nr:HAUS6 protein [Bucorvus abyssinicus]